MPSYPGTISSSTLSQYGVPPIQGYPNLSQPATLGNSYNLNSNIGTTYNNSYPQSPMTFPNSYNPQSPQSPLGFKMQSNPMSILPGQSPLSSNHGNNNYSPCIISPDKLSYSNVSSIISYSNFFILIYK
jgi:hypothetical protein